MLAIIPARSGSKGLRNKNIKLFVDTPLIAHTIKAALKSKYITRVIVSTDDEEIAKIAEKHGAEIPFLRPKHLACDDSLALDNYIYTVNRLNKSDKNISNFIVLQPTSPLRLVEDIDSAIELFNLKNADSVISYTEELHPVSWHKIIDKDLTVKNIFENNIISNRQEFKKTFYPNGAIFIFSFDLILKRKYYSDRTYAYLMPRSRSVDIDTIEDFLYAEFLFKKIK